MRQRSLRGYTVRIGAANVRWVIEQDVFGSGFDLSAAARSLGHEVTAWRDAWWTDGGWPRLAGERVLFHGSLGNADRIRRELPWRPGSACDTEAFRCSAWYPRAEPWLLHAGWRASTAAGLVAAPPLERMFVRPDSPLKPFSGRVVDRAGLSLASLDFGFYYDDPDLPVIVAPVRAVGREWRYVVAGGRVISGSGYAADGRRPIAEDGSGRAWPFAQQIAERLDPPEDPYVLDVCESEGELRLLELNPFSGADLYACDPRAVASAVARIVEP